MKYSTRISQGLELTYFLAIFVFVWGCSSPDSWYNIEVLYQKDEFINKIQKSIPAEEKLLPELRPQKTQVFPKTEQGRIALSLEQAVVISLQNNRQLQVERFFPLLAGTFEQLERGVYDPEVFAEIAYLKEISSETKLNRLKEEDTAVVAGIRQQLPTGTELELSLEYNRSSSNRDPEQQDVRLGLSVTQSLLKSFGPAVNEIERTRQQIEATKVTRQLEEQTLKAEQERFSVGETTSLLVAQAQRDLLVSQLAEVEAIVEYRIALVSLFLAEGSLLERRGIQLNTL